jgi:hypothetical protein
MHYNSAMLWIADVAQAQPTVVYVRDAAGGMSETAKILISATVGALVGIVSNIAMEYVKPWIAKQNLKKTVTLQLVTELAVNYNNIESGVRALEKVTDSGADESRAMALAETILADIDTDRYDFNFASNKALVYEIDPRKRLITVYKALKAASMAAEKLNYKRMKVAFKMASLQAQLFFEENGIPAEATRTIFDELDAFEDTED